MSTPKRTALIESLVKQVRLFIANSILFNQQVAAGLGMNLTDQQVLNVVDLLGSATPGELADLTGLSSGGVTVVLDRLEEAGYIRREKNSADRRSIIVRGVPAALRKILPLYQPVTTGLDRLLGSYNSKQLGIVLEFLTGANQIAPHPILRSASARA